MCTFCYKQSVKNAKSILYSHYLELTLLGPEGCLKYFTLFTSVWFNITNCLINYVLYMFYTLSSMENYLTNIKISLQKFQEENVSTLYFKFYITFKILIFLWNLISRTAGTNSCANKQIIYKSVKSLCVLFVVKKNFPTKIKKKFTDSLMNCL